MSRKPRLGACRRCLSNRPAVTEETITVGSGTYKIPLCNKHADMFYDDIVKWTRLGVIQDEPGTRSLPMATSKPTSAASSPATSTCRTRSGAGRIVASHLAIPSVPQVETPAVPAPRKIYYLSDGLPVGHEGWSFTPHALERMKLRNVSRAEALWCALVPDIVRPSSDPDHPENTVHIRGAVKVVVNVRNKRVVTVVDRNAPKEQELLHASH